MAQASKCNIIRWLYLPCAAFFISVITLATTMLRASLVEAHRVRPLPSPSPSPSPHSVPPWNMAPMAAAGTAKTFSATATVHKKHKRPGQEARTTSLWWATERPADHCFRIPIALRWCRQCRNQGDGSSKGILHIADCSGFSTASGSERAAL